MATSSNNGSMSKNKTTALFYLLMRDAIPTGELLRIINIVKEHDEVIFSNKHLEEMAREYATRLCEE